MDFRRKKIRLAPDAYRGMRLYFVTICTEKRHPVFAKEPVGKWMVAWLIRLAARHGFAVHAYCVMPDHVHLLLEGLNEGCDLARFVSAFKQHTGFAYQQKVGRRLWQTVYYDHVLRKTEEMNRVAWYIWMNPVRKGLCARPEDWPYSGSQTMDWMRMLTPPEELWVPPWK